MAKKQEKSKERSPRISNRKARHDYHISEVVECGMELLGTEVKSLRAGQAKIDEAYARVRSGEAFLVGATISPYPQAAEGMQHDPTRDRKLLLRRRQISQIETHVKQKGKTVVPLAIYFKRGWAKCELGIAEGKRQYDKRHAIRNRDQQRDIAREMSRRRRPEDH
jgi:SsrA-binding protein